MNPLQQTLESLEAGLISYGPDEAAVSVVDTFGAYELEYAAIRNRAGLLDMPQRGVVELRGADRLAVLHNLLTNDTNTLQPGQARRAFLLNQKGRIVADMIVLQEVERTLLDLDVFHAAEVAATIDKLIFTEDVQVSDTSGRWHHLSLHGPAGATALSQMANTAIELQSMQHTTVTLAGAACTVLRRDDAGSPGHHLFVPAADVTAIYQALLATLNYDPKDEQDASVVAKRRGRPIGWLAYNTARIEAGTPLFHIDFGPDSLPHETGVLDDAVSFTKGCYLGQEIVARMQHLGHPKRIVVGLKFGDDRMPVAGAPVRSAAPDDDTIIGAVTSSTLSPLLGNIAIAFATMKWSSHQEGAEVRVPAEGGDVPATVHALRFV